MTSSDDENDVYPGATTSEVLRFLGARLRPWRGHAAATALMVLLRVTISAVAPLCVVMLVDNALPRQDIGLLFVLCSTLLAMGALTSTLTVGESALANWLGQRLVADLRREVFDKTQCMPLGFFTRHAPSEFQTRLVSDLNGIDRFISQTLRSAVAAVMTAVAAVTVMMYLSLPLAAISLGMTTVLAMLNNRFAVRRRTLARERQQRLTQLTGKVADSLSLQGIVLGRTLAGSEHQRERFLGLCEGIRDVTVQQRVIGARTQSSIGFCFNAIPPIIYLMAGTMLQDLSVGMVMALVLLQMRLAEPMMTLLSLSASIQSSMAMFERVVEYARLPARVPPPARKAAGTAAEVQIRGLSHRYPGTSRAALSGVDLTVEAGSMNIVLGTTGSGKSTLGLIVAGLIDAQEGTVALDGTPAATNVRCEHVTLVPQHTTFFSGTIRENLSFGHGGLPEEDFVKSLRTACLDDLIELLPDGLDTLIGEGGHRLSGGERQRLALARALLCGGRLLILDEATSALDGLTAQRVMDRLREASDGLTLLVICHRIPRLEPNDRLLVLEQGRIAEQGPAGELHSAAGAYAGLVEAQNVKNTMEGAPV